MRFQGKVRKDGKFWLAEVPVFDAMTQGRTRKDALDMIADWFVTMADRKGFSIDIHPVGRNAFEARSSDTRTMVSLLLRRQRQKSGLSLAQAAQRLGAKSRNAYARYEQGASAPTVEKLDELLRAVAPGRDIVLQQSTAA
jgi:Helix-turn-helix